MKQRIAHLDGLRGMAALIVVFHHMIIGFYQASNYSASMLHNPPFRLLVNGDFAVVIFLLLSGYVIGIKDSKWSLGKVIETITTRFFRFVLPILATHWIVVLLLMLGWYWNQEAAMLTQSRSWLGAMWQMEPSFLEATRQAFLSVFQAFPRDIVYNSSIWTMPFFFLGPLGLIVFLFIVRPTVLRIGLLTVGIGLLFRTHYWPIIVGYLLARLLRSQVGLPRWLIGLLLALVLIWGNYPRSVSAAQYDWFYGLLPTVTFVHTPQLYQVMAATALVLLLGGWMWLQRLFSGRWMLYLGQISFSLYLFHILVINTVTSGLFVILQPLTDNQTAFGLSLLFSLPVTIIGSVGLYRFVEVPSQRVARIVLQWGLWLPQEVHQRFRRK